MRRLLWLGMIGGLIGSSPAQDFERLFQQGVELAEAGRDVEALVAFRAAARLEPDDPAVHFNLGMILERQGLSRQAVAFFERDSRSGVGYGQDGKAQAGMGTDFADYDGDGFLDLFVTNFDFEYNALYRGGPGGVFSDESYASGVAEPSLNFLGFDTFFFDFDNDGELDLFVANGHILDNREINAGLSYLSQGSLEVPLGLGAETGSDVEVRWPSVRWNSWAAFPAEAA